MGTASNGNSKDLKVLYLYVDWVVLHVWIWYASTHPAPDSGGNEGSWDFYRGPVFVVNRGPCLARTDWGS